MAVTVELSTAVILMMIMRLTHGQGKPTERDKIMVMKNEIVYPSKRVLYPLTQIIQNVVV